MLGKTITVLASGFDCDKGCYHSNNLFDGGLYWAELSKDPNKKDFSALGGLPEYYKLRITYKGKSIIAKKGDVGKGGPRKPKIDIHVNALRALGFYKSHKQFLFPVQIQFLG